MANRLDIPLGKENAVNRAVLAALWHCSERDVRHTIAQLRANPSNDACAILSSAKEPTGYWRSDNPLELKAFLRETINRNCNTLLSLADARRVLLIQSNVLD